MPEGRWVRSLAAMAAAEQVAGLSPGERLGAADHGTYWILLATCIE
jgi:hypothetical protein